MPDVSGRGVPGVAGFPGVKGVTGIVLGYMGLWPTVPEWIQIAYWNI